MKVALLIAGYLRGYEANIDFIQEEILYKFKTVDVYLHITKDEKSEDRYLNQIEETDINNITALLNPISTLIEPNIHYNDNKKVNNIVNHWNKLYKLNTLKKLNEESTGEKYDLVIRFRPDLAIKTKDIFNQTLKNKIYIPKDSKIDKVRLNKNTDGYICDALAFGESKLMDSYFNIFNSIYFLINKKGLVSETILFEYLRMMSIDYELIDIDYSFMLSKCNVFAICGDSGSGKSTLSNLLKDAFSDSFKLECDRYHKWERTDKNWERVTHLNPNANYISKMNEDIFNLKIGNDIFQVDYDHHTGKFTEKQLINPSNNLIVCGLHSLYVDRHSLYDLKIFMDTDEDLKKKWKITRDVKERGYSIEKVLDSIKKRENDFNEYITPQKESADLIVRFFTTEKIDFNDLDTENKLSLELSINKNFDLKHILLYFKLSKVNYELKNGDKFNSIIFYDYQEINFGFKTNTFYDYILYFILNL